MSHSALLEWKQCAKELVKSYWMDIQGKCLALDKSEDEHLLIFVSNMRGALKLFVFGGNPTSLRDAVKGWVTRMQSNG